MSKNSWSSRLSFIITTSAFSVGLGNIWRFPYITGEGGGGAFLLTYLLLVFIIGIPIMTIEISLGRMSGTTTLLGYGKLTDNRFWNWVGWLEVITVTLIMMFYVMILAWVLIYFSESITGSFTGFDAGQLESHFDDISSNISLLFATIIVILILAGYIVSRGLQNGLERYSKWMMVALLIIMISLAVWAATLDGAVAGYKYFLLPDFSKLNLAVVLSAVGQLFFSLGVGMAAAFVFGSYTQRSDNLFSSTAWIVLIDTMIAVLAGLLIFPAIFSFDLAPDSGPNLIFITMASVFGNLDFGNLLGAVFFLLLFLAGFTSLISCMQAIKDSIRDRFNFGDTKSIFIVLALIGGGSIPVVLSYLPEPIMLGEKNYYGIIDYLTGYILLPLGGLMIVIFGGHIIKYENLKTHIQEGAGTLKIKGYWKPIIKYLIPLTVFLILVNGLIN